MAACIRDRDARHKFRNKYKIRSKFRKLRDDNRRLFNENKRIINELDLLRRKLEQHINEWNHEKSITFRATPLDNLPPQGPQTDVVVAITCVAKNEGPYLKEWIEYHKLLGVERFYFYDNESQDNTKEILAPYIKDGTVAYHFLKNHPITKQLPQVEAYNDAIFKYRDRTKWMALIDVDEFIVPVEKNSIPEFLVDYDQHPAVGVYQLHFDSSGHVTKPTAHGGLVTANYTRIRNYPVTCAIKSIVQPKKVLIYKSDRYGQYYLNFLAVNANFEKIRAAASRNPPLIDKIRLNHYNSKSKEEYINKIKRNSKGNPWRYKYNEESFNYPGETTEDLVIQKFVPSLKQALGIIN